MQVVARFKYDWRQEDKEKDSRREGLFFGPVSNILVAHQLKEKSHQSTLKHKIWKAMFLWYERK